MEESQLCLNPQPIQGKCKKKHVCIDAWRAGSQEVRSCRLGQIRMVPLPETWENVIPAISRRSVKKHWLHCGGGCWFKPTTGIKQQLPPQSQAHVHALRGALAELWLQVFCCRWGVNIWQPGYGVTVKAAVDCELLWCVPFCPSPLFQITAVRCKNQLYSTSTFGTL